MSPNFVRGSSGIIQELHEQPVAAPETFGDIALNRIRGVAQLTRKLPFIAKTGKFQECRNCITSLHGFLVHKQFFEIFCHDGGGQRKPPATTSNQQLTN